MLCQCRDTEDFTKPQKADQFFDNLTYSKAIKRLKNEVVFEHGALTFDNFLDMIKYDEFPSDSDVLDFINIFIGYPYDIDWNFVKQLLKYDIIFDRYFYIKKSKNKKQLCRKEIKTDFWEWRKVNKLLPEN